MIKRLIWLMLVILPLALMFGCDKKFGKIDQGRVIAFDSEKKTVTIIKDAKEDPKAPDYTTLPPHTYKLPPLERAMGPAPKAGKRMKLDTKKNEIIIFDDVTQDFKTISYKLIDQKENIEKKNPLVYDEAADKAKKFPVVDREKKTITVYSGRQKILTTFTLPDEYFARPDSTWDNGDEVRIYSKFGDEAKLGVEGKAWKFMNISKTDIYKK